MKYKKFFEFSQFYFKIFIKKSIFNEKSGFILEKNINEVLFSNIS